MAVGRHDGHKASELWRKRLEMPAYTVQDAARYAGVSAQTVSRWFFGGGELGPLFQERERGSGLSYLQLIEVAFVAKCRRYGLSMQKIRRARQYLAEKLSAKYPFAQYRLKTDGAHILLELSEIDPTSQAGNLIVMASQGGQAAWKPLIKEFLDEFEYDGHLAIRWHLCGRESTVVIDPKIRYGEPNVAGVPTRLIKLRWRSGRSVEDLERDYELGREQIIHALRFEGIDPAA